MPCFRKAPLAQAAIAALALSGLGLAALPATAVTYHWTGGNFVPGTTAPSPLLAPDVLNITGGNKSFSGSAASFVNNSLVSWQAGGGTITTGLGVVVSNHGTWDSMGDNAMSYSGGGASFINTGTLRKSGGTGVTSFTGSGLGFTNSGTLDAQTGTLRLAGGPMAFNAGSVFTGAGVVEVAAASTFSGSFSSGNLVLANATHTGNSAVLNGSVNWNAGTLAGTWAVAAGHTLNLTGANKSVAGSGTVLTNHGTVHWLAETLTIGSGAAVVNNGLWEAQSDKSISYPGGGASFSNNGTLRKSAGTGVTLISGSGLGFTNNGTIDAQTGTVRLSAGPMSFNAGSVFTGAGVVEVTTSATFNGAFTSGNLVLAGGTQTGSGAVVNGTVDWRAGTLAGTWAVAAGQTLNLTGANKTISGGDTVVTNNGTVHWLAETLTIGSGAAVVNNGLWEAQSDKSISYPGGTAAFTNNGTLRKSGGTGVTLISGSGLGFTNNGTIDAQTGTVRLSAGPMGFNAGSVFTGAGVVEVTTSATFNGAFTSGNLVLAGGTQTGNGAVINGTVDWRAGTLAGTWAVAAGQTLNLTGANKTISGGGTVVTNDGSVRWEAETLTLGNGAAVVNNGVWDAQGDKSISYAGGGASFTNNGTFVKTGGTGTTTLSGSVGFGVTNPGVVDVQTGTIALPGNFTNTGTLMGDGRYSASGTLNNLGTLAPGSFGAGSLQIASNLLLATTGTLALDLTSMGSFDLLAITGTAGLNGTLALNCLGACSFGVGDSLTVLTSGTRTGTFGSVTLSGFGSGAFDVVYGNNSVRLLVTEAVTAVPEPGTWALMLAGLAAVGGLARRRMAVRG